MINKWNKLQNDIFYFNVLKYENNNDAVNGVMCGVFENHIVSKY